MNVKIKHLKLTGFNSSGIFPDQLVQRISLYEMIIWKNTALFDIILICGQNTAILYAWKNGKKSQWTKKAKHDEASVCVYICKDVKLSFFKTKNNSPLVGDLLSLHIISALYMLSDSTNNFRHRNMK